MLKRIYVNNFRCLVNFELTFDNINLILGHNGSGKSTLFDVISKLQQFIVGESKVEEVFNYKDLTRWQTANTQTFELEFVDNNDTYKYSLEIIYSDIAKTPKLKMESLFISDKIYFEFELNKEGAFGKIKSRLKQDESVQHGILVESAPSSRSIFEYINEEVSTKTAWFKKKISGLYITRINPFEMTSESRTEDNILNKDLSNFSAWYSHLSLSKQGKIIKLTLELQKILTGFDSFQNAKIGNARVLSALFDKPSKASYQFDELSSGQKVLIALYTLIYCTPDEDCTLMIDEPGNFLALPEIQPWLSELIDRCQEDDVQAILISHHPSLINALATDCGYWFERQDNEAVRVQKIVDEGEEGGLSIAKLIEMRWIYDQ